MKNGTWIALAVAAVALIFGSRAKAAEMPVTTPAAPATLPGSDPGAPYFAAIADVATRYSIPYDVLLAVLRLQSRNFDPVVIASAGGIAQFMPETAAELGVERANIAASIDGAARYLGWINTTLIRQFPTAATWRNSVAAFRWGIGNLSKALSAGDLALNTAPQWLKNDLSIFPLHTIEG